MPRCCSGRTTPLWLSPTITNASASRCWKNCPAPDAGRLYFPNSEANKYGLHKEGAFRGVRHPVLDMLVRVYDLLEKVTHQVPASPEERSELRDQATYCRREFISRVQAQVDPRRRVNFLTN